MRPDLLLELERNLKHDSSAGTLRLSRPGMIDRKHYYLLIGMRTSRSGSYAGGVFEHYEKLLEVGAPTEWQLSREERCQRLAGIVTEEFRAGTLVRDKRGKVSREHYTAAISANRKMASGYLKETFTTLDALVGVPCRPEPPIRRHEERVAQWPAPSADAGAGDVAIPSRPPGAHPVQAHVTVPGPRVREKNTPRAAEEGGHGPKTDLPRGSKCHRARERLRSILAADLEVGTVRMSRGGKIHRKHYASLVCIPETSVRTVLLDIFEGFEHQLGSPGSIPQARLSEMRRYLEDEWEAGRLALRDGKIDRTGFMKRFGFRGSSFLKRYPTIRKLIADFDERVRLTDYVPFATQIKLDELDAVLSNGPPLSKSGLAVDRTQVARQIGVPVHYMSLDLYATRLLAADRAHRERLSRDGRAVLLHGRLFDFRNLSKMWPEATVLAVAALFRKLEAAETKSHSVTAYAATLMLFEEVGKYWARKGVAEPSLPRQLEAVEWDEAVRAVAATIRAAVDIAPKTKNARLQGLNRATAIHFRAGVIPDVAKVRGMKNADRLGGRLPSLAEANSRGDAAETRGPIEEYVSFASRTVREAAARRAIEMADHEADAFAASIGKEITRDPALADLSIPQACLKVIDRRLKSLERSACAAIDEARSLMERGEELLAVSTFDAPSFSQAYLAARNSPQLSPLLRASFPLNDGNTSAAVGNLLAFAVQVEAGRMPPAKSDTREGGLGQFFLKRYGELGGRPFLDAHLNPSATAVSAGLTLYLLESGSNVAVGRTVRWDGLYPSELKGHVSVRGAKARAEDKPIIVDLEEGSPAVRAMTWLRTATERRRRRTPASARDSLFLVDGVDGIGQEISEGTFRAHFKKLAADDPELAELELCPSMIRPSVLLKSAIENDGRIQPGAVLGRHGEEISKRYQQRAPVRLLYDQQMRRYLSMYEALAAHVLVEPHVVLGVTPAQFEARMEEVRRTGRTGLGFFCKGVHATRVTDEGNCGTLDCWNECPSMLLVAEVDAIVDLQVWQASLRAEEGRWIRDHVERWAEVWLPWLQFCNTVEEKMSRGPGLLVWEQAAARRMQIEAEPSFAPPLPW